MGHSRCPASVVTDLIKTVLAALGSGAILWIGAWVTARLGERQKKVEAATSAEENRTARAIIAEDTRIAEYRADVAALKAEIQAAEDRAEAREKRYQEKIDALEGKIDGQRETIRRHEDTISGLTRENEALRARVVSLEHDGRTIDVNVSIEEKDRGDG